MTSCLSNICNLCKNNSSRRSNNNNNNSSRRKSNNNNNNNEICEYHLWLTYHSWRHIQKNNIFKYFSTGKLKEKWYCLKFLHDVHLLLTCMCVLSCVMNLYSLHKCVLNGLVHWMIPWMKEEKMDLIVPVHEKWKCPLMASLLFLVRELNVFPAVLVTTGCNKEKNRSVVCFQSQHLSTVFLFSPAEAAAPWPHCTHEQIKYSDVTVSSFPPSSFVACFSDQL